MQSIFKDLPTEILEAIFDLLPSKKDLKSLGAISKRFRGLLESRVFETLTIRANEDAITQFDTRPYASLDASHPLGCLKLIKQVHLKAPFHEKLDQHRCPHRMLYERLPEDSFDTTQSNGTVARLPKLIPLLLQLQENSLVSFSWDLGICIPKHILGDQGYLTNKQTRIESLSLITGAGCWHNHLEPNANMLVLSNFPKLRKFSWKGLRTTEELNALRGLFQVNYRVLQDLELDFIDTVTVMIDRKRAFRDHWEDGLPLFTKSILPHETDGKVKIFVSLDRLALSVFDFSYTEWDILRALNIASLQSLKLHSCPGILGFLSSIVRNGLVLRLKSLDLVAEDDAKESDGVVRSTLINFLQSFQGLEHLHLMLRAERDRPEQWIYRYWNAILHHSASLKRLIYHERRRSSTNLWDEDDNLEQWKDRKLYKFPRSSAEISHSQETHIYNTALPQMCLECFGVADRVRNVLAVMTTPLAMEQKFKLLHIRKTGTRFEHGDYLRPEDPEADFDFEDQIRALITHNPGS